MSDRRAEIDRLRRARPRSRWARFSAAALAALVAHAWLSGEIAFESPRGVGMWIERELVPFPMRGRPFDAGTLGDWAGGILRDGGWTGLEATLAISVLAIAMAGVGGAALCLPAARTFMHPEPFLPSGREPGALRRWVSGGALGLARFVLLFMRAIPEYVWAYLLLAMFGPSAWPAVLALAIHNAGILGKLNSEVVENLDPDALRALRGLGAGRMQIAAAGILPAALPRFLLYFFYRFETCVREATILGMLGIVSLGYWIQEARAARYYDEMMFLVLLGSGLVLAGDLVSAAARRWIRRAGG